MITGKNYLYVGNFCQEHFYAANIIHSKFNYNILSLRFGFIVMDGNGALFGTLQGNTRDVLHKFTVDLPKVIIVTFH